ncbi:hypothetical protein PHMEG_00038639 [Phytophthora megakarya]|uniref:Uncharacterized protein n=1 Tax=Phytophthora megakarya TaxID=4795 RepID=A0A225UGP8_9STRA|nr:hypothetical protein PHMEG_00038639 [Phytophthora megakarya]
MIKNKRELVQEGFANCVEYNANGTVKTTSIKQALSTAPMNPPINFAQITARDFMTWIVSMKKPNGNYHSFAAYAGHRSEFFNLFQDYHCVMSAKLVRELSSYFKGFQYNVTSAVSQGRGQIKVGKDSMIIGLYKRVALSMLENTSRDMIFARLFMIMS